MVSNKSALLSGLVKYLFIPISLIRNFVASITSAVTDKAGKFVPHLTEPIV